MSIELRVTLNISGEYFMPDIFNQSLPKNLVGRVEKTRSIKSISNKKYWYRDFIVPVDEQPEDFLLNLIRSYSKYLDDIDEKLSLKKYASIVTTFKTLSDVRGFYLSSSLIETCNAHGFEIDIDLYG